MPNITITQSSKQHEVLFIIKEFLTSEGIASHVYTSYRPTKTRTNFPVSRLEIRSFYGVRKFLESVFPFLIVKRAKATEMLEYIHSEHWGVHEKREFDPEFIKKLKAWKTRELLELWKDPVYREKITAMTKRTWADPEIRAKRIAGLRRAMEDPETKRKHSEGLAAYWEKKRREKPGVVLP